MSENNTTAKDKRIEDNTARKVFWKKWGQDW